MSLEQWEARSTSSGGGRARSTGPGPQPSQRRVATSTSTQSSIDLVSASHTGGAAQGAASSSVKPKSSREQKKRRGFIVWDPSPDQLLHAQLLLRGTSYYKMDPPICLQSNDPRMAGLPPSKKWKCAYCSTQTSSQLDCVGHTLASHSQIRTPSLCGCRVSTFNSAKALWDHLTLMHNIDTKRLKNKDPPAPWLKCETRTTR